MRLAISNIAWDRHEDEEVAQLLLRYKIDAIDIAHSKYFTDPRNASAAEIAAVQNWWGQRGFTISGMQALMFGTVGLNVFSEAPVQARMLEHLQEVCRIAAGLGARRLVFGSPKNRDRTGLDDAHTHSIAVDFFRRLGDIAGSHDVLICLEPNPPVYGANFMTSSEDTAFVVAEVDHPAIRMQLDTGAIAMNSENPEEIIIRYASLIGHIHASEPQLAPLAEGATPHAEVGRLIAQYLPTHIVSIEMAATKDEPHLHAIERALQVANRHYGIQPGQ